MKKALLDFKIYKDSNGSHSGDLLFKRLEQIKAEMKPHQKLTFQIFTCDGGFEFQCVTRKKANKVEKLKDKITMLEAHIRGDNRDIEHFKNLIKNSEKDIEMCQKELIKAKEELSNVSN